MNTIQKLATRLAFVASRSDINQKHACVALMDGNIISPHFHNYKRTYMFGQYLGSAHSEMAVVNYLLNSLWFERGLQACVL